MHLIRHEVAHLRAFKELCEAEGITEEVCLQLGETFDAAMTEEAWARLTNALQEMRKDHGDDNDMVKMCKVITNQTEAEEATQMKGAIGAIMHATGSMSDYCLHPLLFKSNI
jgi:plasmid maintenance system antidote protein VapI